MSDSKSKERSSRRGRKRKLDPRSKADLEVLEKMARLKVEEVMTRAGMLKCPGCATAVVKEGGCNMVHCVCGELFCYNCGDPVTRCRFSACMFRRQRSAKEAARRCMRRLRRRYPALTLKQCAALLSEDSEDEDDREAKTSS